MSCTEFPRTTRALTNKIDEVLLSDNNELDIGDICEDIIEDIRDFITSEIAKTEYEAEVKYGRTGCTLPNFIIKKEG